ncbi:AzlD domain-containing protein [Kineococcus aurantiacus]|uniref:AzlD domain-containing protein n=1 Tax=Kineococcus aurantiacus TaxID=37633 RepID=UPI003CCE0187
MLEVNFWIAVLAAGVVSFLLKFAGYVVPAGPLEEPRVRRVTAVLPAALLASLVVLQTFSTGRDLVLDARAAGLVVAVVALVCRAPFIVVVVLAAATAAGLRALGWG